ncbi:c-type cytochrome [Kordiimonas sp.]|uniref:c-type cytochrome n=1 Tax=Kordiimonas sp. TaxID=1970157 RepID=UPI003A930E45
MQVNRARSLFIGALACSAIAISSVSFAHGDEEKRFPESQYRHDVMEFVKYAYGNIAQLMKGTAEHDGHLAKHAQIMATAASMAKTAFEKDTRGMEGATDARDEIWENWDDFATRMDKFEADAAALATAAEGGDMSEIGPAFKKTMGNCKSCHDEYRK